VAFQWSCWPPGAWVQHSCQQRRGACTRGGAGGRADLKGLTWLPAWHPRNPRRSQQVILRMAGSENASDTSLTGIYLSVGPVLSSARSARGVYSPSTCQRTPGRAGAPPTASTESAGAVPSGGRSTPLSHSQDHLLLRRGLRRRQAGSHVKPSGPADDLLRLGYRAAALLAGV